MFVGAATKWALIAAVLLSGCVPYPAYDETGPAPVAQPYGGHGYEAYDRAPGAGVAPAATENTVPVVSSREAELSGTTVDHQWLVADPRWSDQVAADRFLHVAALRGAVLASDLRIVREVGGNRVCTTALYPQAGNDSAQRFAASGPSCRWSQRRSGAAAQVTGSVYFVGQPTSDAGDHQRAIAPLARQERVRDLADLLE